MISTSVVLISTSVVVPPCYMLCLHIYGLEQYGDLISVASCFVLFCNLK